MLRLSGCSHLVFLFPNLRGKTPAMPEGRPKEIAGEMRTAGDARLLYAA